MLREVSLFGALAPSLLLYFLVAIPLFLALDRLASPLGFYRLVWHPPLVRAGALCLPFCRTRSIYQTVRKIMKTAARVLLTLVIVAAGCAGGYELWDYY